MSVVSSLASRVYYRLTISGERVPRKGPVLLVANHPNSLLDPMLVAAAARRPVRFLAKAPLFSDRAIGWLIRASGSIPIYRRVDDPEASGQNQDMFRAVTRELARDAVVGIFPEGISHSEPSLTVIKTGAARIVLGAAAATRTITTIMPIGIVLRRKDRFRSEASVLLGKAIDWTDLADASPEDRDAVRNLTGRVETGLRTVTLNLDSWADQPIVECAEEIWLAEHGGGEDEISTLARLRATTDILARMRQSPDEEWMPLVNQVRTHDRRLRMVGLKPRDLKIDTGPRRNLIWAARRFYLVGVPAILVGLISGTFFWIPYWLTGKIVDAARPAADRRSTYQLLIGIVLYGTWLTLVAAALALTVSWVTGILVVVLLPIAGFLGLLVRERWRGAWADIRRYLVLRTRRDFIDGLAERQRKIANELSDLYRVLGSRR